MMEITEKKYDELWDTTDLINDATVDNGNPKLVFKFRESFPTVEEMKEHHVAENLETYFPYLLFYYNNQLETKDEEYLRSFQYIRDLINGNVKFSGQ